MAIDLAAMSDHRVVMVGPVPTICDLLKIQDPRDKPEDDDKDFGRVALTRPFLFKLA
ncbi:MAG: hypothetical protein IPL47_11570 [Phyllobacteriaceae bacterium]|nr:hypothetical protein [Phyllobacteriaceae bacterium]